MSFGEFKNVQIRRYENRKLVTFGQARAEIDRDSSNWFYSSFHDVLIGDNQMLGLHAFQSEVFTRNISNRKFFVFPIGR